jgi:hypothetical protein
VLFHIIAQNTSGIKCGFVLFSPDLELNLPVGWGKIYVERLLDVIGKAGRGGRKLQGFPAKR